VVWAYSPALRGRFLWDDLAHVPDRAGFYTGNGLKLLWSLPGYVQQYYPLSFTTVWTAHRLGAVQAPAYHLLTLAFHLANAFLLAFLLSALGIPAAGWAAALFALHPLQVESVAWISEIKNTQSTFFYLLALASYVRFAGLSREPAIAPEKKRRRWGAYFSALVFFSGALLSKTVACTMPVVALILIGYRRGRLTGRDFLWLAPFIVEGGLLGAWTAQWEKTLIGAQGPGWNFSWTQRILIAGRAFWFYVGKLIWPHPLIFIYPRWPPESLSPAGAWGLAAIVVFFVLLWLGRKAFGGGPLAAFLIFGVCLAPALGFVDMYPMRYSFVADHFQYAASAALIALFAAGAHRLFQKLAHPARWENAVLGALCAVFGVMTASRAQIYRSPETLWRDTLRKNPGCMMAHANLAVELLSKGAFAEAQKESEKAVRLQPDDIDAELVRGDVLLRAGRAEAALACFQRARQEALRLPPGHMAQGRCLYVHCALAQAFSRAQRCGEADREYAAALAALAPLRARPFFDTSPEVLAVVERRLHVGWALCLQAEGRLADAARQAQAAAAPSDAAPGERP